MSKRNLNKNESTATGIKIMAQCFELDDHLSNIDNVKRFTNTILFK